MSGGKVKVTKSKLESLASALRTYTGITDTISLADMPVMISGGSSGSISFDMSKVSIIMPENNIYGGIYGVKTYVAGIKNGNAIIPIHESFYQEFVDFANSSSFAQAAWMAYKDNNGALGDSLSGDSATDLEEYAEMLASDFKKLGNDYYVEISADGLSVGDVIIIDGDMSEWD